MANTPPNNSDPKPNDIARPADAGGTEADLGQPGDGGAQRTVHDVIAALQAEIAELKDKWLRAHAEADNIRKRADREKEEIAKYAVTKLARDIITVGDNFQRAIDAVPADAAEKDPALKSFLDGVTLTERELLNVLERHGIKRLVPKDEPFNPHFHQAMMEVPRGDIPSGTVVQVFQAGYTIEDRVLRPAMVVVSKGGAKPASPTPQAANDTEPPGEG